PAAVPVAVTVASTTPLALLLVALLTALLLAALLLTSLALGVAALLLLAVLLLAVLTATATPAVAGATTGLLRLAVGLGFALLLGGGHELVELETELGLCGVLCGAATLLRLLGGLRNRERGGDGGGIRGGNACTARSAATASGLLGGG